MSEIAAIDEGAARSLPKSPTGIDGLDEITGGGLPRGRPTLVCGAAGCGKTLLAAEFLVRGATRFGEPGVFIAFEETPEEITQNVRSLGFDLDDLVGRERLLIDHVRVERSEIEETGAYDLEGLFIRLGYAIDSVRERVVLDTIETLFGGFTDQAILRSELRRLFRWLKDKGVTAVITAERGEGTLTRQGLEEYVSDCVIVLDHRVTDQLSTRRLRVVKYRGTSHGTNEYPFLIDERGITVLPITSVGLQHEVSDRRVSTGVPRLDAMLGGGGVYSGSSVLISGTAGTGKTSLAAHFVDAACRRGERCLYLAFEESQSQMVRNMRSIGIDLGPWIDRGLLYYHPSRPTTAGLEMHLAAIYRRVRDFDPRLVVVDPISSFLKSGTPREAEAMFMRLIDFLKARQVTALFTSLNGGGQTEDPTEAGITSLIDTWLLLREIELNGERNRGMYAIKSRGMSHSNQVREFLLTDTGIDLKDVYVGPEGVLTGSSRLAQESKEEAAALAHAHEVERLRRELERKSRVLEARIAVLRLENEAEAEEMKALIAREKVREHRLERYRAEMARSRSADNGEPTRPTHQPGGRPE